jgi:4-hydroxy-tetrahydrodipicolinate reductase
LQKADVAIEFSQPDAAYGNIMKCFGADVPVVCGTTGWNKQAEEAKKICLDKNQSFFLAPNFSIGINIMFLHNKQLAKFAEKYGYQLSMAETHHIHKLDAPSGTAKSLAEVVESQMGLSPDVASVRVGELAGTHTVGFEGACDRITVEHEAFSRKGFAEGAVVAALMTEGLTGVHEFKELFFKEENK